MNEEINNQPKNRKMDPSLRKLNVTKQARKSDLPYVKSKFNLIPASQSMLDTCK